MSRRQGRLPSHFQSSLLEAIKGEAAVDDLFIPLARFIYSANNIQQAAHPPTPRGSPLACSILPPHLYQALSVAPGQAQLDSETEIGCWVLWLPLAEGTARCQGLSTSLPALLGKGCAKSPIFSIA